MTLQTDTSGYVNFTGVNVTAIGLSSLQQFILNTTSGKTSIPSLAVKPSGKRTRTVTVSFSVSPTELDQKFFPPQPNANGQPPFQCLNHPESENPLFSLYLKQWLNNYLVINGTSRPYKDSNPSIIDEALSDLRSHKTSVPVPPQFKIQSVELTTTFLLGVDISAGTTPNVLGNGTVFILPVNGMGLDYKPDYSHKIDITFNICENSNPGSPNPSCYQDSSLPAWSALFAEQCWTYAKLSPLLSDVKSPRDVHAPKNPALRLRCDKSISMAS